MIKNGRGVVTALILVGCVGAPMTVQAEALNLSGRSRGEVFSRQTSVLDSRSASQYQSSARYQPKGVVGREGVVVSRAQVPSYRGNYRGQYLSLAKAAARRHGVPEDLFLRLVHQESRWNPRARSHAGAIGLAQLMPATARRLGVNANDPQQNLEGGARYLAQQYRRFGNWRLALAAYNAGPGAVIKYGGVPPYRETQNYVRIILGS